ncbi:MAG TPA: hypothetical protein PK868_07265 [Phycicoccus sp.]|jgi:hypothetical protein|nr:hypothetical protein [Phycicoccus sp.]HQH08635.1 hypothetical protein [Phycicoccus sp.]HQK32138.1 hypothetical protein [Phycicoccus sp.]HQY96852.1 hypothetical protein [Phycicoccus sp.]HRA45274.1 hypothetical protein [Phycicoccus sp.]
MASIRAEATWLEIVDPVAVVAPAAWPEAGTITAAVATPTNPKAANDFTAIWGETAAVARARREGLGARRRP